MPRTTISQASAQAAARQAPHQQASAPAQNTASSDLATLQGADNFAAGLGKLASDVGQASPATPATPAK